MRRSLTLTVATGLLAQTLTACDPAATTGSSNAASNPPVATQLRDLDVAAGVNAKPQTAFRV